MSPADEHIRRRRRRDRRRPVEDEVFAEPLEDLRWEDAPAWAREWFAGLRPRERELLRFDPVLEASEVAALLGVKTDALRQARSRLLKKTLEAFPRELHDRVVDALSKASEQWHFTPSSVTSKSIYRVERQMTDKALSKLRARLKAKARRPLSKRQKRAAEKRLLAAIQAFSG